MARGACVCTLRHSWISRQGGVGAETRSVRSGCTNQLRGWMGAARAASCSAPHPLASTVSHTIPSLFCGRRRPPPLIGLLRSRLALSPLCSDAPWGHQGSATLSVRADLTAPRATLRPCRWQSIPLAAFGVRAALSPLVIQQTRAADDLSRTLAAMRAAGALPSPRRTPPRALFRPPSPRRLRLPHTRTARP